MMQMLLAGGMPVLTDGKRVADEDNPQGYWEFEESVECRAEHPTEARRERLVLWAKDAQLPAGPPSSPHDQPQLWPECDLKGELLNACQSRARILVSGGAGIPG